MSHPYSAAAPSHGGIEGGGGHTAFFTRRQQQRSSTSQGLSSSSLLRNAAGLAVCVGAALGLLLLLAGGIGGSAGEEGSRPQQQQQPLSLSPSSTLLEKGRLPPAAPVVKPPPPPPLPDTKPGRCAAAGKALRARGGWDYMRVMRQGEASNASIVHRGSPSRLQEAIARANEEQRPLRIAVLGGSFSAGGAVADMRDSYAEVLASLLSGTETDGGDGPTGRGVERVAPTPLKHGAEVTNMAQGGAGFMLPLFCTMKVYTMVAEDPSVTPDVWVVEFGENFDASLDQYEALLAMLMFDEARFGRPAVLTAAVAKNFCWWSEGGVRSTQCGLHRTMGWLEEAAQMMDVPLVSFLHGVAPFVGYAPPPPPPPLSPAPPSATSDDKAAAHSNKTYETLPALLLQNSDNLDGKAFPGLYSRLDKVVKQLYADCGENQHFNEYGHRLLGHFLYRLFTEAATTEPSSSPTAQAPRHAANDNKNKEAAVRERMPEKARAVFERVSSGSTSQTLTCNLTLTQGRAVDLVPVSTRNYTLWAEKAEGSSNIFSGARKRSDRKQTWTPDCEGATLDFDLPIAKGATTLCVLMYGSSGMYLNASFPGHETTAGTAPAGTRGRLSGGGDDDDEVEEEEEEEEAEEGTGVWVEGEDGRCRQVQPDGTIRTADCAALAASEKSKGKSASPSKKQQSSPLTTLASTVVDTTCVYRGGVDWTVYSVYKIDCGCLLPYALADGAKHRVRFTNAKGKVQVAGVVIW